MRLERLFRAAWRAMKSEVAPRPASVAIGADWASAPIATTSAFSSLNAPTFAAPSLTALNTSAPNPTTNDLARVQLFVKVSGELNASLVLEDVLARTLDHVTEAFGAPRGSVLLLDSDSGKLGQAAIAQRMRRPERLWASGQLRLGHGLGGWVADQRRGVIVADVERDSRWIWPAGRPHDTRSAVCVPLTFEKEVLGVLTLTHPDVDFFRDDDLALLLAIASSVAVAIHNAKLHTAVQAARQRAEIERSRLSSVITGLPDGLAILDRQFRPTIVNAAATRLLGLGEGTQTSLTALLATGRLRVQGADQETFLNLLSRSESSPGVQVGAEITTTEKRRLKIILAPIRDGRRRSPDTALIAHDVTHEREIERLKDELLANVTHELQTPLASIRACAEMLIDDVDENSPGLRQRLLGIVATEAEQLSVFITNMLDLSRLEAGQLRPNPSVIDVRWVAKEVIVALEASASIAGVSIAVEDEGRPCLALADEQMLTVILSNLIGNAIKYGNHGGHVWVQLRQGQRDALISVVDDGPGIPAEALPRLFERFYRAKSTTQSGMMGTGLGLALVRGLVAAHGGTVNVESELGKGTKFRVRMPTPEHSFAGGGEEP